MDLGRALWWRKAPMRMLAIKSGKPGQWGRLHPQFWLDMNNRQSMEFIARMRSSCALPMEKSWASGGMQSGFA